MEAIHVPRPEGGINFDTVHTVAIVLSRNGTRSTTFFHDGDDSEDVQAMLEVQETLGNQVWLYSRQ